MIFSTVRAVTLVALLLSAAGVAPPAWAQTANTSAYENGTLVDPAAKTLCLAMGRSFKSRAGQISDKMAAFDQAFSNPDADQKKLRDDLTGVQDQLNALGDALEDIYSDAVPPEKIEQDAVDGMALNDILSASQKCVQ